MARIRSIKPDFFTSEQVAECSPSARLLFVGMWCFCDDNGVHPASPARLKMEVFPGDDFTKADIAMMVQELVKHGLVDEYEVNGDRFWLVTGWKHQKIDKPSYKYPLPLSELSTTGSRTIAEASPPEGKGEEWRGEEKEQSSLRSDSSASLTLTPPGLPPADLSKRKADRIQQIAEEAQAAYNRVLAKPNGELTACTVLNKPRLKAVEKALPTVRAICRQLYGNERVTVEFWTALFETAADDEFHSGRKPGGAGHENWKPDFEYLLRENVIAKLFDRAMTEHAA
ncbi:hypothetical protein [Xanthomonas citri]|uniref:hypothetical protein n=1 Tax=Xanthomonas citri TaxID=346 RepID=UPI00069BB98D|nr:hypothetical protein [Xanthomonas citri]